MQTCYEGGNLIGTDDDSTSQVLGFYQMFPSFSEKLFYLEFPSPPYPSPLLTIVETTAKT